MNVKKTSHLVSRLITTSSRCRATFKRRIDSAMAKRSMLALHVTRCRPTFPSTRAIAHPLRPLVGYCAVPRSPLFPMLFRQPAAHKAFPILPAAQSRARPAPAHGKSAPGHCRVVRVAVRNKPLVPCRGRTAQRLCARTLPRTGDGTAGHE